VDTEVKEILPEELIKRLERGEKIQVVDVREQHEWDDGHIPQAIHIPLGTLPEKLPALDKETPIVMVCRSGARSLRATEFAQYYGYKVENMAGGMLAWPGEVTS